jgi:predicted metal-dependent phosphoesterase TrpH
MKVDLHIHTKFSYDGMSTPQEVVDAAIEKGIDCICITDHGQTQGAVKAMKYGFDKNILVIPGIEILSLAGDILGIGVKKPIPDFLLPSQTIREIKKQGGIAVVPHPFWLFNNLKHRKKILLSADALEVFNAGMPAFINRKASIFSGKYNTVFTAGSDAHKAKYVGRAYLDIPGENLSEKQIMEQIKNKVGRPQGKPMGFWERIENGSKLELIKYMNYYRKLKSAQREILRNGGRLE